MDRTLLVIAAGATMAFAPFATAQRIEISSESLGTVVVNPPPIHDVAPKASRPRRVATEAPVRNGIDLGIKRRRDGSLYDPLDPNQNPAAAPATAPGTAQGTNAAGRAPANGARGLTGSAAGNNGQVNTNGNGTTPPTYSPDLQNVVPGAGPANGVPAGSATSGLSGGSGTTGPVGGTLNGAPATLSGGSGTTAPVGGNAGGAATGLSGGSGGAGMSGAGSTGSAGGR